MKPVAHMITVYTSIIINIVIILFSMFALTYIYQKLLLLLYWMQIQLNLQT